MLQLEAVMQNKYIAHESKKFNSHMFFYIRKKFFVTSLHENRKNQLTYDR